MYPLRLGLAALSLTVFAAPDPKVLVEQSVRKEERDDAIARNYTYLENSRQTQWKDGKPDQVEQETHEVSLLYGQPYRKLIARDGKPLPAADARKEQDKLDRTAADRARESPAERERRLASYRADRKKRRDFLAEIPRAYAFRMAGETELDGKPAWIIDATPLADFRPATSRGKMLSKFNGRFYIAKQDATLLKLEAVAIDTVAFGLVLARLDRGARFTLEKTLINNEFWHPSRITVNFDARVALVKKLKVDLQIDYSRFRRFQVESSIVAGKPVER